MSHPPNWLRVDPEVYEGVKQAYKAGERIMDIAEKWDISSRTVSRWAKWGDWRKGRDHRNADQRSEKLAKRLIREGHPLHEVVRRAGITHTTFYRWRRQIKRGQ